MFKKMSEILNKKEISCGNCVSDFKQCKKRDKIVKEDHGFRSELKWCKAKGFLLWSPRDKVYCYDCPMWATTIGYEKNDPKHTKCCRHAEPCWKNPFHSDINNWESFKVEYAKKIAKIHESHKCLACGSYNYMFKKEILVCQDCGFEVEYYPNTKRG